jgi:hypothetical protein
LEEAVKIVLAMSVCVYYATFLWLLNFAGWLCGALLLAGGAQLAGVLSDRPLWTGVGLTASVVIVVLYFCSLSAGSITPLGVVGVIGLVMSQAIPIARSIDHKLGRRSANRQAGQGSRTGVEAEQGAHQER